MYVNNDIDYLKYLRSKKVFVFCAGKQGRKVAHQLLENKILVAGFIDNNIHGSTIYNLQVYSLEEYISLNLSDSFIIISSYQREVKQQLMENNIFNFADADAIDFGGGVEHYDEDYFAWQQPLGEFGSEIKLRMFFEPHISKNMNVIEFGSGGGYLCAKIQAKNVIGVEVNPYARKYAEKNGVKTVSSIDEIADNFADIIISSSVLEHVENPLGELRRLHKKLKDGGKIVFHVPNESCTTEYMRSNIDNHLFTWNCLNLGNLFKAAGFFVCSVQRVQEMWLNNFAQLSREMSKEMFDELCYIKGKSFDANACLIVAQK